MIATDLDPKALPPGLTKLELFEKLNGHMQRVDWHHRPVQNPLLTLSKACNREDFDRNVAHQSPPVADAGGGGEHCTLVRAHHLSRLRQIAAAAVLLFQSG